MRNEMERDLVAAGMLTILKRRGVGCSLLEKVIDKLVDRGKASRNINEVEEGHFRIYVSMLQYIRIL